MRAARRFGLAVLATGVLSTPAVCRQVPPPEAGGRTASFGQPKLWRWQAGGGAGPWFEGPTNRTMVRALAGAYRSLLNPVMGLAEMGVEAWMGLKGDRTEGGVRGLLLVPYLSWGVGADFNVRTGRTDLVLTTRTPVRRGGIFAHGTSLRLDWFPLSSHSFVLGVEAPLFNPLAGRGRPVRNFVVVSGQFEAPVRHQWDEPALMAVMDSVRVSADWIRRTVVPFMDHDGRSAAIALARTRQSLEALRAQLAVRDAEAEVRHFHAEVERAFALAARDSAAGRELARSFRQIVLAEVLLPYDAYLGRQRHADNLNDLNVAARGRFGHQVAAFGRVEERRKEAVMFVFQGLTDILEDMRRVSGREWDDPRLTWLPLQYGLLPEDHDEQGELDALVARATGVDFSGRNRISYVANLAFHEELLRMIRETRDYHVLWIHDFPAVTGGQLDSASFAQVVDGYLGALAARVEAYDTTGTLPSYIIFLDQHYYEERQSRRLMSILEDPLRATPHVAGASPREVAHLDSVLTRLRRAVDSSRVLQAEAREYGNAWLHNRIKVHVNITNRPDASFWGGGLISNSFGYPDDIMRDHRKLSFRDVYEDDPFRGRAILTGMGVGHQYLGPQWDDRSLMMEGPALLELRRAARELLISQGMLERDIPPPLRLRPFSAEAAVRWDPPAGAEGLDARAMALINGTGYLPKPINVAKAVLYSLMPPGSVFKIPDSLWNSTFWGALLTGAAVRGGHALIIAPALANAPSAGFPQMARAHELLTRLLLVREELGDAIAAAGGELRIGMYALPADTNGFASRADRWAHQVAATPFLTSLLPFTPALIPVAAEVGRQGAAPPADSTSLPHIHHKVQFVATAPFIRAITRSPDWPLFMATYLQHRLATYSTLAVYHANQALPDSLEAIAERIFAETRGVPGAASFALVGSQNMDYRGMFMDGEISIVFTGAESLVPMIDLVFLIGTVTWVDDQRTLDRLLPPVGELKRRISRVVKDGV